MTKQSLDPSNADLVSYNEVMRSLGGKAANSPVVFDDMGIFLPNGAAVQITTHMARHYLNTIANKAAVPQADIALWSGRKNLRQNAAYDHETAEELVERIRLIQSPQTLPKIPIDDEKNFEVAQIKESAHTSPFWLVPPVSASEPLPDVWPMP